MKNCKHCGEKLDEKRRGLQCTTCKNGLDRYNLNKLQQIELYESQDKKCKLCNKPIVMFYKENRNKLGLIDHHHSSNEVRGILCLPCNTTLGYIENNLDLEKIKEYIK